MDARNLSGLYSKAHDQMRNIDGLQPQEAFDELLKYLLFKQFSEEDGQQVYVRPTLGSDGAFGGVDAKAAKQIRSLFRQYYGGFNAWSSKLWKDRNFHLSDAALLAIHDTLGDLVLNSINYDIRSHALKTFLSPEVRKGLGIFLTPDEVARMAVEVIDPSPSLRVYDPACGSGTFLIELLSHWKKKSRKRRLEVWGGDVNPRMLMLAELNLGHLDEVVFHRELTDALAPNGESALAQPGQFDVIITNPPFGVTIDSAHYAFDRFSTCADGQGGYKRRQQSEVVFLEQCLRFLKPGGTLAIVLPKSVVSNRSLEVSRRAIDELGYVYAAVSLPAETFAATGTQTTTSVLFFRKHGKRSSSKSVSPVYAEVSNIGFDATGRPRAGNELPELPAAVRSAMDGQALGICRSLGSVSVQSSLQELGALVSEAYGADSGLCLKDLAEVISTGRTPARSAYTDEGMFILKVGNLTGQGINWVPRDRNFISAKEAEKRRLKEALALRENDIVLTSSAHAPKYIAKKVDIIRSMPYGGESTYVGELLCVRARAGVVDPLVLLAFLRHPETTERLQRMVSGQTAHLMPRDVAELTVPDWVVSPPKGVAEVARLLGDEARLAAELNAVTTRIGSLLQKAAQA